MARAPRAPATATTTRSQGNQAGVRSNSTTAQMVVTTRAPARADRPTHEARRCHSDMVPMPTRAPNGGARATV